MKDPAANESNVPTHVIRPEVLTEASPEFWSAHINELVNAGCTAFIKAGQALIAAKAKLGHGNFSKLFKSGGLRIDQHSAQMLMRVANNAALTKATNYAFLPTTLNALHSLAKLDASQLQQAIDKREVFPGMTIKAARFLVLKLAPKKLVPRLPSRQRESKPQHRIEIHEPDLYVRIVDIIEEARRQYPKEAIFQLVWRLADYVQNIYSDENDSATDEFN